MLAMLVDVWRGLEVVMVDEGFQSRSWKKGLWLRASLSLPKDS